MKRPTDDVIRAWRSLLEVHHRLTGSMDQELWDMHRIRLDWYDVLVQLSEAGGRMRMGDLAESTLFSRTDCTRIVDRMQAAGLVARIQAAEDRRGVYALLTDEGKRLLRRAARTHLAAIDREFGTYLTRQEAKTVGSALGRVGGASLRE